MTNGNVVKGATDHGSSLMSSQEAPAGTTFQFKNMQSHYEIATETPEDLQLVLAWIANLSGKSIDQVTLADLLKFSYQATGIDGFPSTPYRPSNGGNQINQLRPTAEMMGHIRNWAAGFYQGRPPVLVSNTAGFVGSEIDLGDASPEQLRQNSAVAYGYVGSAQKIYAENYADSPLPPINLDSIDDPELRELLVRVFGENPPGGFTEGHLNVLKIMGIADGPAGGSPSGWGISPMGKALLHVFAQEGTGFIPDSNLFKLNDPKTEHYISSAGAYFDAEGNWIPADPTSTAGALTTISESYSAIHSAMSHRSESAELPPGLHLPDEVVALMSELGGKSGGFNAIDLNTLVVMGLVHIDKNTNAVSLTPQGQSLLGAVKPPQEQPVEPAPEDKSAEEFWWASYTLVYAHNGAGERMIDHLEAVLKRKSDTNLYKDGKYYGKSVSDEISKMLVGDPPIFNENSRHWEDAGLGHLTQEQRTEILAAMKVWAGNREGLDSISGVQGAGGKNVEVIEQHEAEVWVSRNAFSWIADPSERARLMMDAGIKPDPRWGAYKLDSPELAPHKNQIGEIMANLFGWDINNISQDQLDQALYILETTGFIKMPDPNSLVKVITLGDVSPVAQPEGSEG